MTDEREKPRYLNEPLQPKRPNFEYGTDRSQGHERYERQDDERSSSPRYQDERDYTFGDNGGGERSFGSNGGPHGQSQWGSQDDRSQSSPYSGNRGQRSGQSSSRSGSQSPYGGQGLTGRTDSRTQFGQGPFSGQSTYRSSRFEDRDQERGGFSSSSQPFSSQGSSSTSSWGSQTKGPYSGKGPKGYKRSDQQICEEANQALERHDRVDASEVEVSCTGGVLKLTGKVENRAAKRDAEECVESIYGVSDVMNELKVENGFFANLFGLGSDSDNSDRGSASKSTNKSSKNNL